MAVYGRDLAGNDLVNSPYEYSFKVESDAPSLPPQTVAGDGNTYIVTGYGEDIGLDGTADTGDTGEGNGVLDTEDINANGVLDPGEDLDADGQIDTEDLDGDGFLDGAVRIEYSADELVDPFLGDSTELPRLSEEEGHQVALNLQPIAVFETPVKVFIEIPDATDLSDYDIYLYEPKPDPDPTAGWRLAAVGDGWLEYRENHGPSDTDPMNPPTIELWVHHFTGIGGVSLSADISGDGSSGGGGCFIATAAYGSYSAKDVLIFREFRDKYLLTNVPGRLFVKTYYRLSPPLADFIPQHDSLRAMVRCWLTPLATATNYALTSPQDARQVVFATALLCVVISMATMLETRHRKRQGA
jgi:hypothetical protein